jgi:hypothetical protein
VSEHFKRRAKQLLKVDIAVDADRDGIVTYGGADDTTEDKPYYFWLNNDDDSGSGDEAADSEPSFDDADHKNSVIDGTRDLEDFARLHLNLSSIFDQLAAGTLQLKFAFSQTGLTASPAVNIWGGLGLEDDNGGIAYLEDPEKAGVYALRSAFKSPWRITKSASVAIPQTYWEDFDNTIEDFYFLFEGAGIGRGNLVIEIHGNGQKLRTKEGVKRRK